jgi:hypothetical protein
MLLIIDLMLTLIQNLGGATSCYFAAAAPPARFLRPKTGPCLFFFCFFKQGFAFSRECRDRFSPTDEALATPVFWQ